MDDDVKQKLLDQYHIDVQWLRDNIPPDDIYDFAEQALLSAEFFILKWAEWVDVDEERDKDKLVNIWFQNVIGIMALQAESFKTRLNLEMKDPEKL